MKSRSLRSSQEISGTHWLRTQGKSGAYTWHCTNLRVSWFKEGILLVSCPTRWSLYCYFDFYDDHLSAQIAMYSSFTILSSDSSNTNIATWRLLCLFGTWKKHLLRGTMIHFTIHFKILSLDIKILYYVLFTSLNWLLFWSHLFGCLEACCVRFQLIASCKNTPKIQNLRQFYHWD